MPKPWDKPPRTYTVEDGIVYPSVTEVLGIMDKSGPLIGWAVKECANFVLEEGNNLLHAAKSSDDPHLFLKTLEKTVGLAKGAHRKKSGKALDIGSRVHDIVHSLSKGEPVVLAGEQDEVRRGVDAYRKWVDESGYQSIHSEIVVWSHALRTAGTLDNIGTLPGNVLTLLDWKTSKGVYDEYLIQASVYKACYEERNPDASIERVFIVRFDKETGIPEEREVTIFEDHVECFKGLRAAWDWKQQMKNNKG